jgi:adenylate cyclase
MRLPHRLSQPIRDLLWFTVIGAAVGAVYGHAVAMMDSVALFGLGGVPRGILTGVVTTGLLFSFERGLAQPLLAPLRGTPFLVHLAVKTLIYLIIIWFALVFGGWVFPTPAEAGFWMPIRRQDILFSFAAVLVVRFIDDINHLLGQNVLLNFITGRYHRPRLEQRVFLLIDMQGSTALAERLGELVFHRLEHFQNESL